MEAAEVSHARQCDIHEAIDEVTHPRLAQCDLGADGLAIAQLEGRDRLARARDDRLLAGDLRQIVGGIFDLLAVINTLANAHVEHDLGEDRHLHRIRVTEILGQLAANDLVELRLQTRNV